MRPFAKRILQTLFFTLIILICIAIAGLIILFAINDITDIDNNPTNAYTESIKNNKIKPYEFMGGYFTVINEWSDNEGYYRIMYANDTKVKYLYVKRANQEITITALFTPNGGMQLYAPPPDP